MKINECYSRRTPLSGTVKLALEWLYSCLYPCGKRKWKSKKLTLNSKFHDQQDFLAQKSR